MKIWVQKAKHFATRPCGPTGIVASDNFCVNVTGQPIIKNYKKEEKSTLYQ